jgi:16S rRNA G1207 methylase RsmC
VYNSPLPYRNAMTRSVGRTVVVDSNRKFTVTVSIKPS